MKQRVGMTAADFELRKIERQIENGHVENAVDLVGAVLEVEHAVSQMQPTSNEERLLQYVRELRRRIMLANSAPGTVSREEARHLLEHARPFIERRRAFSHPQPPPHPDTISRIQGKYSQLGLSSEEFLRQKREDLELEDHE
jgi:hypothetical protein